MLCVCVCGVIHIKVYNEFTLFKDEEGVGRRVESRLDKNGADMNTKGIEMAEELVLQGIAIDKSLSSLVGKVFVDLTLLLTAVLNVAIAYAETTDEGRHGRQWI